MEEEKQKLQDPKKVLHLQVFSEIASGKQYLVDVIQSWEKMNKGGVWQQKQSIRCVVI